MAEAPTFEEVHGPGSGIITASKWACLLPELKGLIPRRYPSKKRYMQHLLGTKPFKGGELSMPALMGQCLELAVWKKWMSMGDGGRDKIASFLPQKVCWRKSIPACATLDFYACTVDGVEVNVEIKTTSRNGYRKRWDGDVPIDVQVQCQAQMLCSSLNETYVLCGYPYEGLDYLDMCVNKHVVFRDEQICERLEEAAVELREEMTRERAKLGLPEPTIAVFQGAA